MIDAVILAGRVLEGVPDNGPRAVLLDGERIAAVAPVDDALQAARRSGAPVVDLSGHTVMPGFFDAHTHQPSAARDLLEVATSHVTSIAHLCAELRAECAARADGDWVVTERSLSRAQLDEQRFPTARELDAVSDRHPIVVRFGAHAAVLNSRALACSGLRDLAADPPGGRLERAAAGTPLGPIHEYGALRFVAGQRAEEEDYVDALAAAQRHYAASGITSVRVPGVRPGELAWYQRLRDRGGPLHTRVFASVRIDPNLSLDDKLAYIDSWQVRTGFGDDRLALDGVKLFVDGGVEDDTTVFLSAQELTRLVAAATARGWSVACHAITAAAIEMTLDAYAAARSAVRLVIEHGLFIADAQLRRAADLGVWLSTQPGLIEVNAHLLDQVQRERFCPLRSALDAGVRVALGSDWNATPGTRTRPYAPLRTIAAACRPRAQAIPAREALRLHTRAPAALVGHPSLGLLARGAPADLIAFPGICSPEDLTATSAAAPTDVFVAGHQVLTGSGGTR